MSSIEFAREQAADEETKRDVLRRFREPYTKSAQATGDQKRHSDADNIRRVFGFPRWDREAFHYPSVWPNVIEKTWTPGPNELAGGTDFLATGKPGAGKSTLACYTAERDMEVNNAKVVWRGSSSRSEWLALAPWTCLCLPAGVDFSARLEPKVPTDKPVVLETVEELEEIVREVRRYKNPIDLNRNHLKQGQFHVVYPDPRMRGCEEIYQRSAEKAYDTPPSRDELFAPEDPAGHWWFAWVLARAEWGPHDWTTWIADEIGDLAPQSASKDQFGTYQKVELLRDTWVDARKMGLTVYLFGHSEVDIHQAIRHKIRWRVAMPGSANPTNSGDVVGFREVPMDHDITSSYPVGECLPYNEEHFEQRVRWADISEPSGYKLKIEVES